MGVVGRTAGAAVLVIASAGCWPMAGQGPDRTAHNPVERIVRVDTVARLRRLWTATVDDGPAGDPVTSTRAVHVADASSAYGFDPATGGRLWRVSGGEGQAMDTPSADGDEVLLSHDEAGDTVRVGWVDARTGEPTAETTSWRVSGRRGTRVVAATVWEHPRFPGVWVTTMASHDLRDPEAARWSALWSSGGTQPPQPVLTVGTDAAYEAGPGVIPGAGDCAPESGNALRAVPLAGVELQCGSYVRPSWTLPLPGATAVPPVLAPGGDVVYTATDAGTVHAVEVATGAERWSADVGASVLDSPALAGGNLYVPTAAGLVVVPARGCGTSACPPRWRGADGAAVPAQPAVAGGVVVTGGADGTVRAYRARGCPGARCRPLWIDELGSPVTGAPAISGGRLYVGTEDGRLTAYGVRG